jgi:methyl-accepting chemotaxis protein
MSGTQRSLSSFQLHLVVTTACVTAGFCLMIGLSIFVPLAIQLSRPELDDSIAGGIGRHALDMHASFWPLVVVCMAGAVAAGMLLYRKMTGPLFRFVRAFQALARGESPAPIVIRRTDYLAGETEELNRMLVAVAKRDAERARAVEQILRIADELPTAATGPESAELARELREAAKVIR